MALPCLLWYLCALYDPNYFIQSLVLYLHFMQRPQSKRWFWLFICLYSNSSLSTQTFYWILEFIFSSLGVLHRFLASLELSVSTYVYVWCSVIIGSRSIMRRSCIIKSVSLCTTGVTMNNTGEGKMWIGKVNYIKSLSLNCITTTHSLVVHPWEEWWLNLCV